jgi:hypothetical protein
VILCGGDAGYDLTLRILEGAQDAAGFVERDHHAGRGAGTHPHAQQNRKKLGDLVLHPGALVHPIQRRSAVPGQSEVESTLSVRGEAVDNPGQVLDEAVGGACLRPRQPMARHAVGEELGDRHEVLVR